MRSPQSRRGKIIDTSAESRAFRLKCNNLFRFLESCENLSRRGENTALERNLHRGGVGRASSSSLSSSCIDGRAGFEGCRRQARLRPRDCTSWIFPSSIVFRPCTSTCCFFKAARLPLSLSFSFCESPGRKRGHPVD